MAEMQTAKLKKVLGLSDVLGFVLGSIVGAGVLILTGVGIGLTGKGVVLAFLISGLVNIIAIMPLAQLASALPVTGAGYTYSKLLVGPKWAFLWQIGVIFSKVTVGLYSLSFAQYLQSMYPNAPIKISAILMMTFFYVLNMVGIKSAATTQKWLVVLKVSGLLVFALWGISSVDVSSFASMEALLPKGMDGMLQAIGVVAFASYGALYVVELGGEMKNPSRDIPLGIIAGTIGATLIYMIIAFVASGTLPLDQVANKPLSLVGKSVLPPTAYYYFMMAGVVVSMGTLLNGVFQWVTKGLIVSSRDGWLPKKLGEVNERFGTPHYALSFLYFIGVVTVLSGISLGDLARIGFGFLLLVNLIPIVGCFSLPKKYPEQYAKALFHLKPSLLYPVILVSLIATVGQIFYLFKGLPTNLQMGLSVAVAFSIAYVNIVGNRMNLKEIGKDESF
ncbi:APC family permease [Sporomusa acidovorans]|uniref:Amino acid permease YhdG n=1 Tax=Sporomusa acidovorans (strain ATCC 49682 / DSM 3132 / Mol) TaxID=1123286 RepID=A0ABZ3J6S5_SPOA4|nr:amino acid permease [Sporomusa acidovorans]OZC18499.1 putative amino acid permease YhdG [Sporomusa acidovorans DSM 3132]SDE36705.1 amino acid/polyamine/organocation transporter, APC superfamily [Sporomusa acidovorans]